MSQSFDAGCNYQFTHKSGRHIIAQTWGEMWHMQGHKSEKVPAYLKNEKGEFEAAYHTTYTRLAYKEWNSIPMNMFSAGRSAYMSMLTKLEEAMNKFWDGAKGYEQLTGRRHLHTSFRVFCPLKRFLYNMMNEAAMEGNTVKYDKAEAMIPRGNQLFLPACAA